MRINHRDGTHTQVSTSRQSDEPYKLHVDIEMEDTEYSLTMRLPDGTFLIIHHFPTLGSGVTVYDNPDENPVVTYSRRSSG